MSERREKWLPVFPLQVVLFPGAYLPLHIFEPRYRAMTARCQREGLSFVVILVRAGELASIGCLTRLERVLQTYPDGRSDILTRGESRVRLLELREHEDGYHEGRVESVTDELEEPDPDARMALQQLFSEYRRLQEQEQGIPAEEGEPAESNGGTEGEGSGYTWALANALQIDPAERQSLLECRSERRREQRLIRLLARILPQLRSAGENRRRIRGNGKPISTT